MNKLVFLGGLLCILGLMPSLLLSHPYDYISFFGFWVTGVSIMVFEFVKALLKKESATK